MLPVFWDIIRPGGLAQRRKKQMLLDRVVDEALLASELEPHPQRTVLISEQRFRELATYTQTSLGEAASTFSPTDIVHEIRERGYEPKPPEPKKQTISKIPTTVVLGVIAALLLLRGKEKQI